MPNVDAICFPSRDENGLPTDRISEDKIVLDCLVGCFSDFNDGKDDFPHHLDDLKANLMENLGVDIDQLRSQQRQTSELKVQLEEITSRKSDLKTLVETRAAQISDIKKMETHTRGIEERCLYYKDQIKRKIDRQLELTTQIQVS